MITTKEQEREALAKISKILAELGEDSYVATAMEGTLEIAERNIRDDSLCSLKKEVEHLNKCVDHWQDVSTEERTRRLGLEDDKRHLEEKIRSLNESLDKALDWHPYGEYSNMKKGDYIELYSSCKALDTTFTVPNAIDKIHEYFGFEKRLIEVLDYIPVYEINKYGQLREVAREERKPLFFASDWNYVRFDVMGVEYEMVNGQLEFDGRR